MPRDRHDERPRRARPVSNQFEPDDDSRDELPAERNRPGFPAWAIAAIVGSIVVMVAVAGSVVFAIGNRQAKAVQAEAAAQAAAPAIDMTDKPLTTICATRPTGPFIVRGECSLGTDFIAEYSDSSATHLCILLHDRKHDGEFVACYIGRDSPDGIKLLKALSGGPREMTLVCRFSGSGVRATSLDRVESYK